MSACLSLPITLLAVCSDAVPNVVDLAADAPVAEDLLVALSAVSDPRKSRGVRHRLLTVLASAVCAVLAGARSYVMIAEWAHDLPVSARLRLGIGLRGTPSESTIRRILQRVDPDELDVAVSGWLARRVTAPASSNMPILSSRSTSSGGPMRAIALDGKTARGARVGDGRAVHLLGALDHATGVVLGQTEVDHKTNEITAFAPLLERIDRACPLAGAVITADALCRCRHNASYEDLRVMPMCWPEPRVHGVLPVVEVGIIARRIGVAPLSSTERDEHEGSCVDRGHGPVGAVR